MLRLITGGAKTGKSTKIKEELLAASEHAPAGSLLLLVPEQFSYETEREYFQTLGILKAERVLVFSFQRLAEEILRECGGIAGKEATDAARLITMKLALADCRGLLRLYGPLVNRPDFPGQMVHAVSELKYGGLSSDDLLSASARAKDGLLKDKLSDLGLILSAYQGKLSQSFADALDKPLRALKWMAEARWFAGKAVWLDGFKSFTAVQEQMLFTMLSQGAEVTIALSMEHDGRFETTRQTAKRLRALAHRAGARVPKEETLTESFGYQDEALRHFAANALKNRPIPWPNPQNAVECAALTSEFDEAQFAAAKLLDLIRQRGYAFEETAVLVRDFETYAPLLEAAFDRYRIPYYMDRVESVDTMPLIRFVSHALGALVLGFSRSELLSVLKCGILETSLAEIAAFESYTYVWNIEGDRFFSPFTQNPAGYADRDLSDGERRELSMAEKVRKLLLDTLTALRRDGEKTSYPRAVYALLQSLGILKATSDRALALKQSGRQRDGEDLIRTWEVLIELLDTLETVLSGTSVTLREFRELFLSSAAYYELGRIPQSLDSVLVGSAERVRIAGKKCVLLLGANERAFPLLPSKEGLFSDREREELKDLGLELSGNQEERILEERFVAWQALSYPTEYLMVTYALGDIAGKPKFPSPLVTAFREIFPKSPIKQPGDFSEDFYCRDERTTFLRYVRSCTEQSPFSASAREFLLGRGYGEQIARLEETLERSRFRLKDERLARRMFGGRLRISPTQIENYFICRFAYFCRYGLKLQARAKAEWNPLSRGSVTHFLLERILSGEYGDFKSLSDEALQKLIEELLFAYLEEAMGGTSEKTQKFLYYYRRMGRAALGVFKALREEFAQTEFVVAGLEVPVSEDGSIPPLVVPVGADDTVTIVGKIDRVDLLQREGMRYARIVDYKTGRKEFSLDAAAQGLNLQMLLYLFALWKNGRKEYADATPAGILYMPAGAPKPSLPRDAGEEEQTRALEEAFAMNGLLLDDRTVLCAMEKDLSGRFLPVSMGKSGIKGKYLATLTDFENLERYTEELVRGMAETLFSGNISPDPVGEGQSVPCAYCDYRTVCGHEARDGCRLVEKTTLEEIGGRVREENGKP